MRICKVFRNTLHSFRFSVFNRQKGIDAGEDEAHGV